mmetsp:Transcript_42193/g.98493  ORF Transcript_42193/g.98493 Transcript_42193/m.98493 type:complete len:766 (+) Transcript_42193:75-2372(+)
MAVVQDNYHNSKLLKHSCFYWVHVPRGQEIANLNPTMVADKFGVPVKELFSYWEKEVNCDKAVKTLPRTLSLIICFAAMLLNHEVVGETQSVEKAIRFDIEENANFAFNDISTMGHKNYQDVNSFADFWSWMRLGFSAVYLPQTSAVSEGSTLPPVNLTMMEMARYLTFNSKLGPVKLSQETAQEGQCVNSDHLGLIDCYTKGTDFVIHPTEFDVGLTEFVEDKSKEEWIPLTGDLNAVFDHLETTGWLAPSTRRWKVSFVTYNADHDILTVTAIHFVLSRSGHIWKEIAFMSLLMQPYANLWGLVWEILFFGSITTIFIEEVMEIIRGLCATRGDGRCRCRLTYFFMDYLTVWNFVDWCSIIIAYTLLGMWISRCLALQDLNDVVNGAVSECTSGTGNCEDQTSAVMEKATTAGLISVQTSLVSSFYPFCILLRLFKTFSLQPRLAVVTRTLWMSFADLVHFGIIFLSVFVTYVFMAMGFFGRTVEGYSDFGISFITLFRSLMGDADYIAMEDQVGRAIAGVFHISFMLCMLLILLNMLIAIIMDVYGETKRAAQFSDPVWNDITDFFSRWYHARKGDRISLAHAKDQFLAHLEEKADGEEEAAQDANSYKEKSRGSSMFVDLEDSEEIVTVHDLTRKVEKMTEEQARHSIVEAVKWYAMTQPMTVESVDILRGIRQLHQKFGIEQEDNHTVQFSELVQETAAAEEQEALAKAATGPGLKSLLAESARRTELENGLSERARKMLSNLLDTAQTILEEECVDRRL